MKLSELIRKREVATVTVATHATVSPIHTPSVATVASVNVATANESIPKTLQDRQREARRQIVIDMLEAEPDTPRAIYTDTDSDPHNVILAIAVRSVAMRGVAACEMTIPKATYDPWQLLLLLERLGQVTH